MEVDDQIETGAPEPSRERHIVRDPTETSWPLGNEDLVEMWIVLDDRRSRTLDKVGDRCVGIMLPQRRDRRRREDDVADQAKPNQKDSQGSTVASSISITGMSSLMGYTR